MTLTSLFKAGPGGVIVADELTRTRVDVANQWLVQVERPDGSAPTTVAVQVTDVPSVGSPCVQTGYATVVVGNHKPVASAGGPYTGVSGAVVTLSAGASSDPDPGDTISYAWDLQSNGLFGDSTNA